VIVLDTNVLVSGLLTPRGSPAHVLRLVFSGHVLVAHDHRIIAEYRGVLFRGRLGFDRGVVEEVLEVIERQGFATVALPLRQVLPDPGDAIFLEVARSARADSIVTGNKRHFPASIAGPLGIRILSPSEFLRDIAE